MQSSGNPRRNRILARAMASLLVLLAALPVLGEAQRDDAPVRPFARGVTVSCFRSGPGEWDSPQMRRTLAEIHDLGGNAMTFHPYARIGGDGSVRARLREDDASVLRPLAFANELSMRAMVKPHLAYWGSPFSWRGEIRFDTDEQWRRFFDGYERFIVHQARLAQRGGAAVFCVGTELGGTVHREREWRRIIAAVRREFDGELVYAANWDRYQDVPFWDALDAIGVQCYFPLADGPDVTPEEIHRGWDRVLDEMRTFADEHNRPVVLTELGYNRSSLGPIEPWNHREGGPDAEHWKLECMRIALDRVEAAPFIRGVYLWKWFPTPREFNRDFVLQYPEMKTLLRAAWAAGR